MKTLKLYNGGDWKSEGGHLYVAAYSQKDCCDLVNEAYRKIQGYQNRPDIVCLTLSSMRIYWASGCWGAGMNGVPVERGVWWLKAWNAKPEKIG